MKLLNLETTQIRPPAPTRNLGAPAPLPASDLLGMHVTEAGEGVLQTPCGEFDSHRLQIFHGKPLCGNF